MTTTTTKKTKTVTPLSFEAHVYSAEGKKSGSITLPESVFGVAWNESLVHQVVTSMMDNARTPVAHTKTRGDVRGGGRKPWKQKGTGRARHGSIRSPIWRGGGVTHGPRNDKVYARAIPKKMRAKALFMVLSRRFKEGKVIFVDSFGIETPKTALAVKALTSLAKIEGMSKLNSNRNAAYVAFADPTSAHIKSFSNIGSVEAKGVRELNPVALLKYKFLILENPDAALAIIGARAERMASGVTPKKI